MAQGEEYGPGSVALDVGGDPDDYLDACLGGYAPLVDGSCGDDRLGGVELAGAQGRDDRLSGAEGALVARGPLDRDVVSVWVGDDC